MTRRTSKTRPIPIPLGRRTRRLWMLVGPFAVWALAIAVAANIHALQGRAVTAHGIISSPEVVLSPLTEGRLVSTSVALYQEVKAGQVVAVFDDSHVKAECDVLQASADRLRAQIAAERDRIALENRREENDRLMEIRRLEMDLNRAQLDVYDRRVDLETNRVEVQRLRHEASRYERLAEIGSGEQAEFDYYRMMADEVARNVEEAETALGQAMAQVEDARGRLEEFQGAPVALADAASAVTPIEREIEVLTAQVELTNSRLPSLILRSPIDGTVAGIYASQGQDLQAGSPVLRIVASEATQLVAYLPDGSRQQPTVGAQALIRPMGNGAAPVEGRVVALGPGFEPLPARLVTNPNRVEAGLPVLIQFVPGSFTPGELVSVAFTR